MKITVDIRSAVRSLTGLTGMTTIAKLGAVAGRAVVNAVRSHLISYNASHANKLGGKRTNFWVKAARSAHMEPKPHGADVSINHLGFRLQYQGGTVRPVKKRYLTIPAVPEAHAKAAGEFSDLEFAYVPRNGRMAPALVEARQTKIKISKGKKGASVKPIESSLGTKVIFWLARKVTIPANPAVLPTEAALAAAGTTAVTSFYEREIARQLASNN